MCLNSPIQGSKVFMCCRTTSDRANKKCANPKKRVPSLSDFTNSRYHTTNRAVEVDSRALHQERASWEYRIPFGSIYVRGGRVCHCASQQPVIQRQVTNDVPNYRRHRRGVSVSPQFQDVLVLNRTFSRVFTLCPNSSHSEVKKESEKAISAAKSSVRARGVFNI